ncbi:hypothetical protein SPRG_20126, partial [Saprolegnia parasitica CBS 223.65]
GRSRGCRSIDTSRFLKLCERGPSVRAGLASVPSCNVACNDDLKRGLASRYVFSSCRCVLVVLLSSLLAADASDDLKGVLAGGDGSDATATALGSCTLSTDAIKLDRNLVGGASEGVTSFVTSFLGA